MSNDALDSSLVAFLSMTQDDFDTSLSAGVYAGQPTVSFKGSQIFITIKNLSVIAVDDPATARMPSAEAVIVDRLAASPDIGGPGKSEIDYKRSMQKMNSLYGMLGVDRAAPGQDVLAKLQESWLTIKMVTNVYNDKATGEERSTVRAGQWLKVSADRPASLTDGAVG